jgi:hypothetical protein
MRTIFSVIYRILDELNRFLQRASDNIPETSFRFISENVRETINYAINQLPTLRKKIESLENTTLSSPLLLSFTARDHHVLPGLRDSITENAEYVRQMISNIIRPHSVLHAYGFVHEILERFGVGIPFVLIESDGFSNRRVLGRLFGEYASFGIDTKLEDLDLETITYSGIDADSPEALFMFAHQAFHLVERYVLRPDGQRSLFENFCETCRIQISNESGERCREAFIDSMASMYLGPAYVVGLCNQFFRTLPDSEEQRSMMITRLNLLTRISRTMQYELPGLDVSELTVRIDQVQRSMNPREQAAAAEDSENIARLLESGMIHYVQELFAARAIRTYSEFLDFWSKSEAGVMNETRIRFCLEHNIPIAVRPTILLNTMMKYKEEARREVASQTIFTSLRKWCVKRTYEKALEQEHVFS